MKKIIQFIKYNNAFVIILGLIFASAAGALANETSREAIVGKTIVTRIGMDNARIISADLENFEMGLKIKSVKEDGEFYYVNFDYNAIDAKDGVWQTVKKEKNINVSKIRLGDMDLGLYLAEELKQLTSQEMAYMKEVQGIEKNKGAQKQVESVEYTGLKGLVFNDETKEIDGYNPVKEKENQKAEVVGVFNPSSGEEDEESKQTDEGEGKTSPQVTVVKEVISKETIMQMVKEALAQEQASEVSASSAVFVSSSSVSSSEAPSQSSSESSSQPSSETAAGQASPIFSSESSSSSSETASSSSSSESASSSSLSALPTGQAGGEAGSSSEASSESSVSSESSSSISSSSESSYQVESSSSSSEASSSSSAESSSSESSSSVAI